MLMLFGATLHTRYDRDSVALTVYRMLPLAVAAPRLAIRWYATGHAHLLFAQVEARTRWAGLAAAPILPAENLAAIAIADTAPAPVWRSTPLAWRSIS